MSLLFLILAAAPAPEPERLAQQSFAEAEAAFGRREYAAAAAAFEQAARAVPHPSPWLNAAEAWEKAGALDRAAEDCDRVLALKGAAALSRAEAEARLARFGTQLGQLLLEGPDTTQVELDGRRSDLVARRWLTPGPHSLRLWDPSSGAERRVELNVGRGDVLEEGLLVPPVPELATATSSSTTWAGVGPSLSEPSGGPPVASWAAFGLAGAAVVTTAVFGGLTLSAQSDFEQTPSRDTADVFYDRRLGANLALSTAVVAAGIGLLFWALER